MNDAASDMIEREAGPSWERPNWPVTELDELNLGLDPTAGDDREAQGGGRRESGRAPARSPDEIRRAAEDSIRAMMLIRTYRVRGHLAADLDPLGLTRRDVPADLTPAYHGFSDADLDRPIWICGALGFEQATVREIVRCCRRPTAATSASNICTSTRSRSGASSRTGSRAPRTPSSSRPKASSRS